MNYVIAALVIWGLTAAVIGSYWAVIFFIDRIRWRRRIQRRLEQINRDYPNPQDSAGA